jgi:hypothetical protein
MDSAGSSHYRKRDELEKGEDRSKGGEAVLFQAKLLVAISFVYVAAGSCRFREAQAQ